MITFGIPLKGRRASEDWNVTCSLFQRTLRSVTSQTRVSWHVIVACDEVPPLPDEYTDDKRIEFLILRPNHFLSPMDDKGRKVNAIAFKHRENGGGYLMLVDADDMVSNRIAELCDKMDVNGFISKTGYIYFEGSKLLRIIRNPWKICGSCTIVNWQIDDLPPHLADTIEELNEFRHKYIVNASHDAIPSMMALRGRALSTSPFAISVYSCGNGENNSILSSNCTIKAVAKNLLRLLHPVRLLTPRIAQEFSVYPLSTVR